MSSVKGGEYAKAALAFTRHCHHQYCMVYGIQIVTKEGSVSVCGRVLRNGRAICNINVIRLAMQVLGGGQQHGD